MRFTYNLKSKSKGKSDFREGEICAEEVDESKKLWVKYEQYFIQKDSKYKRMKNSLNLYFDENSLVHSKTRFSELTEMSHERKHPLLLRNNSYFTKLIVLDSHEKVFHNGVDIALNFVGATYWIIKGRQTVKSILRKCVTCKLVYGKTVTPPKEPSLPSFRIDYTYPFETVGIDYAGAIFHKFTTGRNVEMKKCYLLLITCTSTRAVNLEVTTDANANSLLLALRRFFA